MEIKRASVTDSLGSKHTIVLDKDLGGYGIEFDGVTTGETFSNTDLGKSRAIQYFDNIVNDQNNIDHFTFF